MKIFIYKIQVKNTIPSEPNSGTSFCQTSNKTLFISHKTRECTLLIKLHLQLSAGFKAVYCLNAKESRRTLTRSSICSTAPMCLHIKLTESETQKTCSHSAQKTIPVEMNLEAPQQSCYHFHLHQLSDLLGLRPESDLQDF